jgi:CRP/FNR family transcriptional regulator, cyclic AMP receptor protein
MEFAFRDHLGCSVLLESMRGTVCTALFTGSPRVVGRGERIFNAGDAADALFQVRSGLIKLTATTPAGDEMLLEVYYPEAIFGEMCFCDEAHTATATAIEDSEVLTASLGQLRNVLRQQPDLALTLFGEFAARLSSAYSNLQTAVFDIVLTRIAVKLAELAAHGQRADDGTSELLYKVPHSDLAEMLGVRRETVTRAMVELRRLNLIAYLPDGRLRLDAAKLQEYIAQIARMR